MEKPITHYYRVGESHSKTVVFLHGFMEDSSVWQLLAETLKDCCQVLCLDLLGHGKTPAIAPIHTMEQMADALHEVLVFEQIEHCTLVGHSMGGYVALAFAERYPKAVEGIVLMNSHPFPDSEEKKVNRDRVLKVIEKEKELFVRTAVTNLFASENREKFKPALEKLIQIALNTPNEGIKAASMGMKSRPDRTEVFKHLKAKKLLVAGKADSLIPYTMLEELATKAGAVCELLSGGHLSFVEDDFATKRILREFVQK